MDIDIRPAKPDDVELAVPLIYSSGPYSFDYVFARRDKTSCEFLSRAFADNRGEFGHQNHVSVVVDGRVVGAGCIFSSHDTLSYMIHGVRQIIGHYGPIAGAGVIRRGLQIERVVQPAKGDLWILAHLGIAPEMQGKGLGGRLIEHLLDSIRRQGGTRAALDVALINPRAEALYKQFGFVVTDVRKSKLSNQFGTVPNFHRMELQL